MSTLRRLHADCKCLSDKQRSIKKFFSGFSDKQAEQTLGEKSAEEPAGTLAACQCKSYMYSGNRNQNNRVEFPSGRAMPPCSSIIETTECEPRSSETVETTKSFATSDVNSSGRESNNNVQYVLSQSDGEKEILAVFSNVFDGNGERKIGLHYFYMCSKGCCSSIPTYDKYGDNSTSKFKVSHAWLLNRKLSFDEVTGLWWPVYIEKTRLYK